MMHRVNNVGLTASVLPAKIPIFETAWITHVAHAPEMASFLLALLKYFAPRVCSNLLTNSLCWFISLPGSDNCNTCSGSACGVSVCNSCNDGYYVSNGACVLCLFFETNESCFTTCSTGADGCQDCQIGLGSSCTTCYDGYAMSTGGSCSPCLCGLCMFIRDLIMFQART